MMRKIFYMGINVISVLFTVFLISFIFCRRIFINKQKVEIILENIEFFQTLLFFSLLLTIGYSIILFVKIKTESTGFFTEKLIWFSLLIKKYDPFYHAYSIIFDKIDPIYLNYLVRFTKTLLEFSDKTNKLIIFLFVSLPRILILFVLLFDIFIMQKLHYYFFALILLIIPLIFRFIVFIFTDLSKKVLPEIKKFLIIGKPEPVIVNSEKGKAFFDSVDPKVKNWDTIAIKLKPECRDMNLDNVLFNFYYPMLFLPGHMEVNFLPIFSKISSYTKLIYFGIQSCCWMYIIIII